LLESKTSDKYKAAKKSLDPTNRKRLGPIGYAIVSDLMSGKANIKHVCVSYFPSCPILKPQPKATFGHVSVSNVKVEKCLALTLCSISLSIVRLNSINEQKKIFKIRYR